jgi:hypothetical protein
MAINICVRLGMERSAPLPTRRRSGKPEIGAHFRLWIFSYAVFGSPPRVMFKPGDDFLTGRRLHDS